MPRTLPTGLKELLQTGYAESHSVVTLELTVPSGAPTSATTLWYYLGTSAITAENVTYQARLAARGAVSLLRQSLGNAIDRAEIAIEDADGAFTAELKQYGDNLLDGAKVRIGRVWQNLDTQQQYVTWLMSGLVSNAQHGDTGIQLSVVSENYAGGAIGGNRVVTRQCGWQFKGRECGYSGSESTCNLLYEDAGGCSGRSNQHRYGGFVHLQGRNAVGGAVGLAAPPIGSGGSPINNIPSGVYNVVRDYSATGDGVADDTTEIQNAIDAAYAAGGGTVYLPDKTYKTTASLVLKDKVSLKGAHWRKTIIYSTANEPIIKVSTTATDASIETLTVKGSVTAGSSQIGIEAEGSAQYSGLMVRDVWIEDCGDHGFYVGINPFSCVFKNIHISNCADYPFLLAATIAPGMSLEDCYAHVLRSGAAVGFRIKSGKWQLVRCNGTDNVPALSGTKWAVVGKKPSVDGDSTHGGAAVEFIACNIEAFHSHGVHVYYNSVVSFRGRCEFAGNNNDGNYKALEFDLANDGVDYYAPFTLRGFLEDTVIFGGGFSNFANSQPIHANGMPPIQLNGQGPYCDGPGNARAAFYYHTPTSTTQALPRADGMFAVQTITGATTLQPGGARFIRCNHSSAFTLTLPYAGWDARSQSPIVVVDVSSAGAGTNKITINAAGGSTINGLSSVEIATNKGSLTFLSDGDTDYRVVQGSTLVPMFDDQPNGRITTPRRIAGPDATASAPAFTFENEYGAGVGHPSNRIVTVSTTLTSGGDGKEAVRFDGTGGSFVRTLFSSGSASVGVVGALVDGQIDFGESGNYRVRDIHATRTVKTGTSVVTPQVSWNSGETIKDLTGSGSPEGVVTAAVGSVYRRTDGGTGTTVYFKESGTGNTGWAAAGSGQPVREKLTAARTYYVSTTGSDSNNGLSAGAPFLTIQKAVDVASSLDLSTYNCTIQLADGTYTAGAVLKPYVGAGFIIIKGNSSNSAAVTVSTTNAHCFTASDCYSLYWLQFLKVQTTTSGFGVAAQRNSSLLLQNMNFGACASAHIIVSRSFVEMYGAYTISGSSPTHAYLVSGAFFQLLGYAVTLTGTPNFSGAFCSADAASVALIGGGTTFSGSATGQRYAVSANSLLNTYASGATYLPGNVAGTTATGGQYI